MTYISRDNKHRATIPVKTDALKFCSLKKNRSRIIISKFQTVYSVCNICATA